MSDSIGPIDILHETPSLDCSQTSSYNSLVKSMLVLLANLFLTLVALKFAKSNQHAPLLLLDVLHL